ncbi:MAG: PDZ domain-containing protein, partial [Planctomycetes bacterium]|nr:PDZ domain-containing protein [Planctomycetota bacterium]
TWVARVHPAGRDVAPRLRAALRVGGVVRAATEGEARAVGLGPGGGAVVVGLTRESPWRALGVRYGDLIRAVDGAPIGHPEALLDAIRSAPDDAELELELVRAGKALSLEAPLSRREHEVRRVAVPILFDYERDRGESTTSVLLGLVRWRSTDAAWDLRILWLLRFGGGDADRLEEVDA